MVYARFYVCRRSRRRLLARTERVRAALEAERRHCRVNSGSGIRKAALAMTRRNRQLC